MKYWIPLLPTAQPFSDANRFCQQAAGVSQTVCSAPLQRLSFLLLPRQVDTTMTGSGAYSAPFSSGSLKSRLETSLRQDPGIFEREGEGSQGKEHKSIYIIKPVTTVDRSAQYQEGC